MFLRSSVPDFHDGYTKTAKMDKDFRNPSSKQIQTHQVELANY